MICTRSLNDRSARHSGVGGPPPTDLLPLLRAIDDAYTAADEDRRQLERSLHLASEELFERNRRLESELEERKRLEVELHLGEKLRTVGQLAAGIAHEINTPVQFIGDGLTFLRDAFGELEQLLAAHAGVLETAAPGSTRDEIVAALRDLTERSDLPYLRAEIPRALGRCDDGALRVATIVRALKTFAHPDRSDQQLADVNAAIENTLAVAAHEIKYVADVALDLAFEGSVRCHIGEIQQVLLNLFVNAGHAISERVGDSGKRGLVRIATRNEGGEMVITVSDDGAGIPASARDRIFEPFFTTKAVGKGTGQGLSIARSLVVDRHGGKLTFDTTIGKGTTFTIRLAAQGPTPLDPPRGPKELAT
jgi:two-component system, NtrC family, sensor kinase